MDIRLCLFPVYVTASSQLHSLEYRQRVRVINWNRQAEMPKLRNYFSSFCAEERPSLKIAKPTGRESEAIIARPWLPISHTSHLMSAQTRTPSGGGRLACGLSF
jgi:hypothetical protein